MKRAIGILACVALAASTAAAAPILPDDASLAGNLTLWLKADSLAVSHGGSVTTWADSGPGGNDAVALASTAGGTPLVPPTLAKVAVGLQPAVQFKKSAAEVLKAAAIQGGSTVTDSTIIAVYQVDSNAEPGRPAGFGNRLDEASPPSNVHWHPAPDPSMRFDGSNIGPGNYSSGHPTNRFITRTATKTAGQVFNDYFDGTQVLTNHNHGSLNVVDDFFVGDLHNSAVPTGPTNMSMAEVIVYDKVLTTTERQGVEEYLANKYQQTRGYWRFENGTAGSPDPGSSGNVEDSSYFGNDGTAQSGGGAPLPTYSSDTPPNVVLPPTPTTLSLDFERGNGNRVVIGDDDSLDFGNSAYTLEAYVKLETLGSNSLGGRNYVMMKKNIGTADAGTDYALLASAGNLFGGSPRSLLLQLGNGGGDTRIVSDLTIEDNDWHYISAAFDPDRDLVRFILDGVEDFKTTSFVPAINAGELVLGGHFNAGGSLDAPFDGWLDEVRISAGFLPRNELLFAPEPGTMALLGLGLAALARRRRKTR
jgi:hypothetical protein